MLVNNPQRRQFSIVTKKSIKEEANKPLEERMKFFSFSSQEKRFNKKRMFYFLILLMIVLMFIIHFGLNSSSVKDIKINENEIEKVNG